MEVGRVGQERQVGQDRQVRLDRQDAAEAVKAGCRGSPVEVADSIA